MLENHMNKLITLLLIATFSVTAYCEKVKMNDLTERNGVYFKKSSEVPFTGELEGRYQGRMVDGKRDGLWLTYSPEGNLWFKNYKWNNYGYLCIIRMAIFVQSHFMIWVLNYQPKNMMKKVN